MAEKPFGTPVEVRLGSRRVTVGSAEQAAQLLADAGWPERGPRHRDAVDACLKVLDGHRSTIDAEQAFAEAAREAGMLVGE